jgi:hypothetical protein
MTQRQPDFSILSGTWQRYTPERIEFFLWCCRRVPSRMSAWALHLRTFILEIVVLGALILLAMPAVVRSQPADWQPADFRPVPLTERFTPNGAASLSLHPFSLQSVWALSPSLWRDGKNAAGLSSARATTEGRSALTLTSANGTFRRPQDPERDAPFMLLSEGIQRFGQWTSTGTFTYHRFNRTNLRWSLVSNPYRGTPFIWADSAGGDWQTDALTLHGALGSPEFWKGLSGGMGITYQASQGARQDGGRPLYRTREFSLSPSLAWRLSEAFRIGLSLVYSNFFEEGEYGSTLGSGSLELLSLRGLSSARKTLSDNADRRMIGSRLGGGVQLQGESGVWQWSATSAYRTGRDSTQDFAFIPELNSINWQFAGRFDVRVFTASVSLRGNFASSGAELNSTFFHSEGKGTDPVFFAVNTTDNNMTASFGAAWWRGAARRLSPFSLFLNTQIYQRNPRDILGETSWRVMQSAAELGISSRLKFSERVSLFAMVSGGYAFGSSPQYSAARPVFITEPLTRRDFLFNSSNRFSIHVLAALDTRLHQLRGARLRVVGECGVLQAVQPLNSNPAFSFGNRSLVQVGIELAYE